MTAEPTITCPSCSTEIKLTESLAAPLLRATREEYEARMSRMNAEISRREGDLKQQLAAVEEVRQSVEQQVAEKVRGERAAIAAEEAKKASAAAVAELESKAKELTELKQVLAQQNEKLTAAQKQQAELLRKQRELDDAKRELDLTVETRVQQSLGEIRLRARAEAEDALKLKVTEKNSRLRPCSGKLTSFGARPNKVRSNFRVKHSKSN